MHIPETEKDRGRERERGKKNYPSSFFPSALRLKLLFLLERKRRKVESESLA